MEENGQKNVVDNVENMEQSQSENEEELKEEQSILKGIWKIVEFILLFGGIVGGFLGLVLVMLGGVYSLIGKVCPGILEIIGLRVAGVGEYLKDKKASVQAIAVEPASSPVLSEGKSGAHKIQGIGAGFVPDVLNTKIYDEIVKVENEAAFETGKLIAKEEGILVGISSGAALWAGIEEAKKPENKGKTIVVLLPDSGDRYYSTPLFTE